MADFPFETISRSGDARTAKLVTPRGTIDTPAFMPVGTAGTVKALYMSQVAKAGADIILGNTYHLMLRPGAQRMKLFGGLHKFSGWHKPILTDSGGFQIWSLANLRKIDSEGVSFRSHIDGALLRLTPESSIQIQAEMLGADICMQLDECTDFPVDYETAKASSELSLTWGERSRVAFNERETQTLFGIVQGSNYRDLREKSVKGAVSQGFGGYAIGGLAVGEGHVQMCETLEWTTSLLPKDRPRYLMGVGKPIDIVESVARGIDMFDCVLPTRSGRHGQAWTWEGPKNLKNAQYSEDMSPIDEEVNCPASRDYSRAYIHHLFKANEYLGPMLLSWHNISFFQALMKRLRVSIEDGTFECLRQTLTKRWSDTKSQSGLNSKV